MWKVPPGTRIMSTGDWVALVPLMRSVLLIAQYGGPQIDASFDVALIATLSQGENSTAHRGRRATEGSAYQSGCGLERSTPLGEECPQQRHRLTLAHTADDLRVVMAGSGIEYPCPVLHPSTFRVVGREYQPPNPEEARRLGAH